jgi:hypothetical protein
MFFICAASTVEYRQPFYNLERIQIIRHQHIHSHIENYRIVDMFRLGF